MAYVTAAVFFVIWPYVIAPALFVSTNLTSKNTTGGPKLISKTASSLVSVCGLQHLGYSPGSLQEQRFGQYCLSLSLTVVSQWIAPLLLLLRTQRC